MKDSFMAILAIIGTVIGSGFISGKEIVVFFARFGYYSFPCIFIACVLFFFLFKFMLNKGCEAIERLTKSKICFLINIILCLIFSSAMFAGIGNLLVFDKKIINFIIFFVILLFCFSVYRHGMGSLNKLNLFLVPLMIFVLLIGLISKISFTTIDISSNYGALSFVYSALYVVLNTSNGSVLIARYGQKLTSKQKVQVAFFSALALFLLLLIADIVLLSNPSAFLKTMPLLSLFTSQMYIIMTLAIFIGCLTTLLTLVYTLSSSMRGLCKNEYLIFFTSVMLPLIFSLLGFDFIVEYLYPLSSVLGIFLICALFFKPKSFKKQL